VRTRVRCSTSGLFNPCFSTGQEEAPKEQVCQADVSDPNRKLRSKTSANELAFRRLQTLTRGRQGFRPFRGPEDEVIQVAYQNGGGHQVGPCASSARAGAGCHTPCVECPASTVRVRHRLGLAVKEACENGLPRPPTEGGFSCLVFCRSVVYDSSFILVWLSRHPRPIRTKLSGVAIGSKLKSRSAGECRKACSVFV
jgi:hypothetical protein